MRSSLVYLLLCRSIQLLAQLARGAANAAFHVVIGRNLRAW